MSEQLPLPTPQLTLQQFTLLEDLYKHRGHNRPYGMEGELGDELVALGLARLARGYEAAFFITGRGVEIYEHLIETGIYPF